MVNQSSLFEEIHSLRCQIKESRSEVESLLLERRRLSKSVFELRCVLSQNLLSENKTSKELSQLTKTKRSLSNKDIELEVEIAEVSSHTLVEKEDNERLKKALQVKLEEQKNLNSKMLRRHSNKTEISFTGEHNIMGMSSRKLRRRSMGNAHFSSRSLVQVSRKWQRLFA